MPKSQVSKELRASLEKLLEQQALKKEHTNAFNRLNTEVRNIFKARIQSNDWTLGTKIRFGGHEFAYDASDSTVIDPADLYTKLKDGEITEEQFLKCIKVNKSDVSTVLGSDVTLTLETPVKGENYSVRIKELPLDDKDDEYIAVPTATSIKRKTRRSLGKVTSVKPIPTGTRKIKVKRKQS